MDLFYPGGRAFIVMKEAMYYDVINDGKVRCRLCPFNCTIDDGQGVCKARKI
jgi:pyruvate formate lyase activating enzyme